MENPLVKNEKSANYNLKFRFVKLKNPLSKIENPLGKIQNRLRRN
jgi:hypothetical protein